MRQTPMFSMKCCLIALGLGVLLQGVALGSDTRKDAGVQSRGPSLRLSLPRDASSPFILVDPRGLVVSEVLSTIASANVYTHVEYPEDDSGELLRIEVDGAEVGTYFLYLKQLQSDLPGTLSIRAEAGDRHCGETIEPSMAGMPRHIFAYRFTLELTEDGCLVREVDGR